MLSIIVAARNDDYGGGFRDRFLGAARHNASLLRATGVPFEYVLVEWNPLPDRDLLARDVIAALPEARAVVVPADVHAAYSLNPHMAFHEMAAKNVGLRRARGEWVLATNADILLGASVVRSISEGTLRNDTLYRARRVDVARDTPIDRLADPAWRIQSGEGERPSCDYLGAGGDFCLASRTIWHELCGFDEITRFTTRAKDWQFFLSAIERGVPIAWLGEVYHLEHGGGFRNTPAAERSSERAHFGPPWDFEFGLPFDNGPEWGLGALGSVSPQDARIEVLETAGWTPGWDTDRDRWVWDAVRATMPDHRRAWLLHLLLSAHARNASVHVRPHFRSTAAALAGFAPIAADAGLTLSVDWRWPDLPGLSVRGFTEPTFVAPGPCAPGKPEAAAPGNIWTVTESGAGLLARGEDGAPLRIWPRRRRPELPVFDPMLARRVFRVWLQCQSEGIRRIALFGAGSHTEAVLSLGVPDTVSIDTIVVSKQGSGWLHGIPIVTLTPRVVSQLDAVVLSSVSFEGEMREAAIRAGARRVISVYEGWPRRAESGVSADRTEREVA